MSYEWVSVVSKAEREYVRISETGKRLIVTSSTSHLEHYVNEDLEALSFPARSGWSMVGMGESGSTTCVPSGFTTFATREGSDGQTEDLVFPLTPRTELAQASHPCLSVLGLPLGSPRFAVFSLTPQAHWKRRMKRISVIKDRERGQ